MTKSLLSGAWRAGRQRFGVVGNLPPVAGRQRVAAIGERADRPVPQA